MTYRLARSSTFLIQADRPSPRLPAARSYRSFLSGLTRSPSQAVSPLSSLGLPRGRFGCSIKRIMYQQIIIDKPLAPVFNVNTLIAEAAMANMKYFSGTTELSGVHALDNKKFAAAFPGVKGRRYDGYSMFVGHPIAGPDAILPVERVITYKSFPSKHECNAKCMGGKVNGTCECSCGGKNHGLGSALSGVLRTAA